MYFVTAALRAFDLLFVFVFAEREGSFEFCLTCLAEVFVHRHNDLASTQRILSPLTITRSDEHHWVAPKRQVRTNYKAPVSILVPLRFLPLI